MPDTSNAVVNEKIFFYYWWFWKNLDYIQTTSTEWAVHHGHQ